MYSTENVTKIGDLLLKKLYFSDVSAKLKIIEEPISDTSATTTTTIRPTESVTEVTTSIKEEEQQPLNTTSKSADDEDENEDEALTLPKNNVLEPFEFSEFVRGGNHKPLDLRK